MSQPLGERPTDRAVAMAVLVAALGYFVDIYDLILFGVVRTPSLRDLGVPAERLKDEGVFLINMQMIGMLVGGFLWGVIADRRGRLSVLFASIVTYSLANLANAAVTDLDQYAALRFVAGVGLAGELGAGVTLVAELMHRQQRGWGTTVIAAVGICGGVVASLVGGMVPWRHAYVIGGVMGLALLALRIGVRESGMFRGVAGRAELRRGDLWQLFGHPRRVARYLAVVVVGVPIWFVVGVLVTFSPELGRAMGVAPAPEAPRAFLWCYVGLALGDVASGALSQVLRSRRRALAAFLALTVAAIAAYFTLGRGSQGAFYAACGLLGFASGYWAVFMTSAAEQFGTNLRGTVSTTAPNVVRGAVVPATLAFTALTPSLGVVGAAMAVGAAAVALAAVALAALPETYGRDLDFVEE